MVTATCPTPLQELRVLDVMHPGVIACPTDTPLRTVARMMATYRVHAVVVMAHEGDDLPHGSLWGIISDADLVQAARTADLDAETAGMLAQGPPVSVATTEPLERAVELMAEHGTTHLVVLERQSQRPIGIVSTLDVARGIAGYRIGPAGKLTPWAMAL